MLCLLLCWGCAWSLQFSRLETAAGCELIALRLVTSLTSLSGALSVMPARPVGLPLCLLLVSHSWVQSASQKYQLCFPLCPLYQAIAVTSHMSSLSGFMKPQCHAQGITAQLRIRQSGRTQSPSEGVVIIRELSTRLCFVASCFFLTDHHPPALCVTYPHVLN